PVGTAISSGRREVTPTSAATKRARAASGTATVDWREITARSAGSSARSGASAARGGAELVTGARKRPDAVRHPGVTIVGVGREPIQWGIDDIRCRRTTTESVEVVHGDVDAVAHDALDRVGGPLDDDVDLGALALGELLEHVVDAMLLRDRLPDADADPQEGVGVEVRLDRAQAVVPGQAAAVLHLQHPDREVELVLHDHELLGLHAVAPDERGDREP